MLSSFQRNTVISLNISAVPFIGISTSRTPVSLMLDCFCFYLFSDCFCLSFSSSFTIIMSSLYVSNFIFCIVLFLAISNARICPIRVTYRYPQFISLSLQSPYHLTGLFIIPYASFCFTEFMFSLNSMAWIHSEDAKPSLFFLSYFLMGCVLFVFAFSVFL